MFKIFEGGKLPEKKHIGDCGYDCYLPSDIYLPAHTVLAVNLKVGIKLKSDECAIICPRSSISKMNIMISTSPIDNGYTGPIHMIIYNLSDWDMSFKAGQRLCQIVILKIPNNKDEPNIVRDDKGFGSSCK